MKNMLKFLLVTEIIMTVLTLLSPYVSPATAEYEQMVETQQQLALQEYYQVLPASMREYLDAGADDRQRLDQILNTLSPEEQQRVLEYSEAQEVLAESSGELSGKPQQILAALAILYFILYLAGIIGIWKFRNWGRLCYVISVILYICLIPLLGDSFSSNFGNLFGTLSDMLAGTILIMLFIEPISSEFRHVQKS